MIAAEIPGRTDSEGGTVTGGPVPPLPPPVHQNGRLLEKALFPNRVRPRFPPHFSQPGFHGHPSYGLMDSGKVILDTAFERSRSIGLGWPPALQREYRPWLAPGPAPAHGLASLPKKRDLESFSFGLYLLQAYFVMNQRNDPVELFHLRTRSRSPVGGDGWGPRFAMPSRQPIAFSFAADAVNPRFPPSCRNVCKCSRRCMCPPPAMALMPKTFWSKDVIKSQN
ncbi:hypothetical protein SKAU_G00346200 [Synaphobranchus kaupii]|uniref:Uncharacterized protein n=1 Tax=Synaphobranchus kaupii TaxID=118154 RepID=A0A9Q1EJK8_SYNKA|nr:hypothetical protein SKAU_G00346200 [Synaphobranchus kaupii]